MVVGRRLGPNRLPLPFDADECIWCPPTNGIRPSSDAYCAALSYFCGARQHKVAGQVLCSMEQVFASGALPDLPSMMAAASAVPMIVSLLCSGMRESEEGAARLLFRLAKRRRLHLHGAPGAPMRGETAASAVPPDLRLQHDKPGGRGGARSAAAPSRQQLQRLLQQR